MSMFYIHNVACISAQNSFAAPDLGTLVDCSVNKMVAIEPAYNMPANMARRMSKTVRMATGAALSLIDGFKPDGIIMGTANGSMVESGKFLDQIVEFDEDTLSPANFVQSTPNNSGSQLSILTNNTNYNVTHVHRALAFENAAIDAAMLLRENPANTYLLGAVDEIAGYNYNIDTLGHWHKKEDITAATLYSTQTPGSIPGEGAAIFLVNNKSEGARARVHAIEQVHTTDEQVVKQRFERFLSTHALNDRPILLLSGENGDSRLQHYYDICESVLPVTTTVARFKHMTGEYPTAISFAVWLSAMLLDGSIELPAHAIKEQGEYINHNSILIYNNYKGLQHSFMLIGKA